MNLLLMKIGGRDDDYAGKRIKQNSNIFFFFTKSNSKKKETDEII